MLRRLPRLLAFLPVVGFLLALPSTSGTSPVDNGEITFSHDLAFGWWTVNPDGSAPTFHDAPGDVIDLAWAPDGSKVALTLRNFGETDIWLANPDGSGLVQLTDVPGHDTGAAWSPDGTRIAFSSRRTGSAQIWVMDADGGNPTQLTDFPSADFPYPAAYGPHWSPDGTRIAFIRGFDAAFIATLNVMDADGSNIQPLLAPCCGTFRDQPPRWFPDGSKILFARTEGLPDGFETQLYLVDANLSDLTQLTFLDGALTGGPFVGGAVAWSPDGLRIAFYYDGAVAVMAANGTGVVPLYDLEHLTALDWRRTTFERGEHKAHVPGLARQ